MNTTQTTTSTMNEAPTFTAHLYQAEVKVGWLRLSDLPDELLVTSDCSEHSLVRPAMPILRVFRLVAREAGKAHYLFDYYLDLNDYERLAKTNPENFRSYPTAPPSPELPSECPL